MFPYDFWSAQTMEEALDCLQRGRRVQILAGGTDLLVNLHKASPRLKPFEILLDISHISELNFIKETNHSLEIGPLVTHSDLMSEPVIKQYGHLLVQAAQTIGSTQIRNRGTIGGNIVNASPAADLIPPLIALRAEVECTSLRGKRRISLEEFLTGPYQTKLLPGEILTRIRIPLLGEYDYANFQKIGRRKALSIARLSLALVTRINQKGIFQDTRIVPGSATPYPQSFPETEKMVNGKSMDNINVDEISEIIADEMISITGERWSTPYKRPTLAVLMKRALNRVMQEAKKHA